MFLNIRFADNGQLRRRRTASAVRWRRRFAPKTTAANSLMERRGEGMELVDGDLNVLVELWGRVKSMKNRNHGDEIKPLVSF